MRLFPGLEIKAGVDQGVAPAAVEPEAAEGVDPAETSPASLSLTRRQERQLWDAVKRIDNFWETLDETEPGIIRRLAETARARRWEVMFLTSRPRTAGDVVQLQSQRWLRTHGFEYPALFVVSTSRGKIAVQPRARRRRRRPAGELPRHRDRFQGARDSDLARRSERRARQRAPPRHRRRELRRRVPRSAHRRRQPRRGTDLAGRSSQGSARSQARDLGPRVIVNLQFLPLARILPRPLRIPSQTEPESRPTEL